MALLMDEERVGDIGGLGCMGNEGVQWIGMSDFLERDHFIQNIGDGTYFHSGQLAVQASVAAGVNVTYKLLYNGAVAMTGGQDPQAQLDIPAVSANLLNEGVAQVLITTNDVEKYDDVNLPVGVEVWSRDRMIEAQERLAKIPGTTVLIHDQACAAELRRARTRRLLPMPPKRVVINHRICEGCGDCGRVSNCLSVQPIETPFGRKTEIDQTTCNFDYSCLEGDCPSFMTVTTRRPGLFSRWTQAEPASLARPARERPIPPESLPEPVRIVPDDEFAMRITGIGGTGVVTVGQVVGTAAMLDGYHVRGLDQIGLSQKAGPVVSDLRFSRTAPSSTNRLGAGQADLLLAFDQLVAASDLGLLTADPERTTVVGSTTAIPTGDMISHPEIEQPSIEDLCKRIAGQTRREAQFWAEAAGTTEDLFGTATSSNVFVVGMAVQAGCLPVSPESIEEAIRLNGVAIEANLDAFRWGRVQIADPEAVRLARRKPEMPALVESQPTPRVSAPLAARIAALDPRPDQVLRLTLLARELVAWGGEREAVRWLDVLDRVAQAEQMARSGSRRLTLAVAENLFKLMAYKDEYEVARLMLDEDGTAVAQTVARALPGGRGRLAWQLHPPLLRALGLRRKISIGRWAAPLIRLLARARFLRGTPFDPFGRTQLRRFERALSAEYVAALDEILARLGTGDLEEAVALAELPDAIRGYEHLKLERIARFRAELAARKNAFSAARSGRSA
jgi:indolepyruvate ferredoxin oxidoreductase